MNPVITKMEHFQIIVNNVQPLAIVAKSFSLNVVGFMNLPLHKFAAKAVSWFKPETMVMYTCITQGKVFEQIRETYFGQPNFVKFAAKTTAAHSVTITAKLYIVYHGKQSQGVLFLDNLSTLTQEIAKYYCITSSVHNLSFHNLFHLAHEKVHDEANMCTL